MKINPFYITPFLVAIVLLIGGCDGTGTGNGGTLAPFVGGTEGLDVAFMEGAPPAYIYDNNAMGYNIQVKIENRGEINVEPHSYQVNIVGIDPQEFGLDAGQDPGDLIEGMKKDIDGNTIPGGISYWTYTSNNGYSGVMSGDTTFNIRADICYRYGSKAESMLCVKRDLQDIENNPVCLVSEPKTVANAGSPIQVTSVREERGGNNRIRFTFQISHRGTGLVSSDPGCSDDLLYENKVHLVVTSGLPATPQCNLGGSSNTNEGTIQLLTNGIRTITCTQEIPANTLDFEKVLKIDMDYYYKDHISQALTVKHAS